LAVAEDGAQSFLREERVRRGDTVMRDCCNASASMIRPPSPS
jgi:hypothetical protein